MTSAARRRAVADAIDALDNEIATLQDSKRDAFEDYRDKLSAEGMRDGEIKLEIKALKKAIARRRALLAKPDEVEEVDEKIDEITVDIMKNSVSGTKLAARTHVVRSASREAETPHDAETGEVLGDAPVPSPESLGPLQSTEEQPSPSEPRSLTDRAPEDTSRSACANPAAAQVVTGQSGMTASTPYRVTDPTQTPAAPDPELSPLIADVAARQEAARRLLGQAEAAE